MVTNKWGTRSPPNLPPTQGWFTMTWLDKIRESELQQPDQPFPVEINTRNGSSNGNGNGNENYVAQAIAGEVQNVLNAPRPNPATKQKGGRNHQLNISALKLATLL